jgi:hypothetical protein
MPLSVRLPPRVEQKLADYCVSHKVSKTEAVKRALEQMLENSASESSAYDLGKRFMGSDRRSGDVARHTKQLLRQRFRAK